MDNNEPSQASSPLQTTDAVGEDQHDEQQQLGEQRITSYLVVSSLICFLGSPLQFGYNLAVVNAPELVIKRYFHNRENFEFLWSLAVSIFTIGGMIGAFCGPHIARVVGRKKTLMLNNVLVILGGLLLFFVKESKSVTLLCIGRTIVGLNCGVNTQVAPMYLSEIAPIRIRGSLGTLSQFGIVTGLLLGNILGLKWVLGNATGWPLLFGITGIIGLGQLILLPFCPESPRWLISCKDNESDATAVLKKLRGTSNISAEVAEIKEDAARESQLERVGVLELFTDSYYHKPLLISVVMQLAQQLSGIGGVLFYSTSLFVDLGVSEQYSQVATCGVGGLSVIMTGVVIWLVEVAGRRALMLVGLAGMAMTYVVVTVSFVYDTHHWAKIIGVIATLSTVTFFQAGPGAIPWFIVSELFSQASISSAFSVAGPTNWLANFLVALLFPVMKQKLYPFTFIPFTVSVIIFFSFTFFVVPETKGRTIAEVNAELRGGQVSDRGNETTPLISRDK